MSKIKGQGDTTANRERKMKKKRRELNIQRRGYGCLKLPCASFPAKTSRKSQRR
jgi:hypothetical protein